MTQEQAREVYKEIERWAKAPNGTKVWNRKKNDHTWYIAEPLWAEYHIYVIGDEWAELRMAQIDGKQLQFYCSDENRWCDQPLEEIHFKCSTPSEWRIKPEIEFPVYRREKKQGFIVRFDDYEIGTIVMSDNKKGRKIGFTSEYWASCTDKDIWESVENIEIDGQNLYDTQPVWVRDVGDNMKMLKFIDAKNKCVFRTIGERNGWEPDYIEPVKFEHIEDWMIESWKKLKI